MSKDEYGFDSQKLMYHPERVAQWLKNPFSVYPIYVEIAPTNNCNHRCTFCGCDFLGYQKIYLNPSTLKERLSEMAKLGIKSVMYAGEGEPLLHKDIAEIILYTKKTGIDVAVTTNGVPFTEKLAEKTLGLLSWIKVSIDAGTKETYSTIHGCPEEHFEMVFKNLEAAVVIRNKNNYKCAIGAQLLLLPENLEEILSLAYYLRRIGVDYLVVKPYSQYPLSLTERYASLSYPPSQLFQVKEKLERFYGEDERFKVIIREHTMRKLNAHNKGYQQCCAVPYFWAYIDSRGDIYTCSAYLANHKFLIGNYKTSFKEVWESDLRKKNAEFVAKELDVSQCRKNCRMDEINRYLWLLKNPPEHVNFP